PRRLEYWPEQSRDPPHSPTRRSSDLKKGPPPTVGRRRIPGPPPQRAAKVPSEGPPRPRSVKAPEPPLAGAAVPVPLQGEVQGEIRRMFLGWLVVCPVVGPSATGQFF